MSDLDKRRNQMAEKAVERFGRNNQLWQFIEEVAELIVAICRKRRGRGTDDEIAEEVADVRITLEQIPKIYRIENKVRFYEEAKLDRLEDVIEGRVIR